MLKIALTGNIGSGKSIAAKVFSFLNIPIFDADLIAKQQYDKLEVVEELKEIFGQNIVDKQNKIKKHIIAEKIFSDDALHKTITNIIHPLVKTEFKKWYGKFDTNIPYCIHESAVIFEGGFDEDIDYIILVTAPLDKRIERVKKRNNWSEDEIKAREAKQISEEEKIKLSDFIIVNDETQPILPQILNLHDRIKFLNSEITT